MRLFASAALFVLALTTSVAAQTAAPPAAEPPAAGAKQEAKKDEGVICRRETPTGSLFAVKVCTTPEQRKAQGGAVRNAQGAMQSGQQVIPQ